MSYGRAFAWHAEREPDRIAVRHDDAAISYAALDRRANRLARAYAGRGVGPGTLVTLALPNSIEFFAACLATWRLGATPQPVSSRLPERERRAIVELAQPALVVGAPAGEATRSRRCRSASSPTRIRPTRRCPIWSRARCAA